MTLPTTWRRFLERTVPEPGPGPRGTRITQHGTLRLESGKWAPFTAVQTFESARCGFSWRARVRMAPLVTAVVEDAYQDGHGRLDARLYGLVRVMQGEPGPALDRGELIRYLAELAWNPLALLDNPELRHAEAPGGKARVWAHDPDSYVDCTFDGQGDLVEVESTTRARGNTGPAPWSARFLRYAQQGPARVPVEAEVSWDLPEGRLVYWRGTVVSLEWWDPPRQAVVAR